MGIISENFPNGYNLQNSQKWEVNEMMGRIILFVIFLVLSFHKDGLSKM